jgi:hypothetical protein
MFSSKFNRAVGKGTIISGIVNLDTAILTTGRTSPDAIAYSVGSLTPTTAVLTSAPDSGALSSGDEVLLLSTMGTLTQYSNVGNYEFLIVDSVVGSTVTFKSSKTLFYGSAPDSDAGLGVVYGESQIVSLRRVPNFINLVVASGSTLTCNNYNDMLGGVICFRCDNLENLGTITATAKGYLGATGGHQGTGINGGRGTITWTPTIGGGSWFPQYGGYGNNGNYAEKGADNAPIYGTPDLGKLFFGGSAGSYYSPGGGNGGGIIFINSKNISTLGDIFSNGGDQWNQFCSSGAGGSIRINNLGSIDATKYSNLTTKSGNAGMGPLSVGRIAVYTGSKTGTINSTPLLSEYQL